MLRSATFRLTLWYLAIIAAISGLFSGVLYEASVRQLDANFRRQSPIFRTLPQTYYNQYHFEDLLGQQFEAAKRQLQARLLLVNLLILSGGGAASYLLARRTLRPIEEALEAQSRFTADASHELRTPLTAMKTEIEVALRERELSATEARALLRSNLEEVDKLERLAAALLRLARHDGSEIPLAACELAAVTEEAARRVAKAAVKRNVTIHHQVEPATIRGDEASLVELVVILLDNAIKYSPKGSNVMLRSKVQGHRVELSVVDEGDGIEPNDLPHLFDRFYRADRSRTKEKVEGYGLGLSIARQIAEHHQGSIEVASTPGKGSVFAVHLPLMPGEKNRTHNG